MANELREAVRVAAELRLPRDERAQPIADLIRTSTGRRWVGIYITALASTGSELIVPVKVGDEVVGTLDVEDEGTDAFSDDDRRLFERLAGELVSLYD